ncbi:MAG: ATP-binding cassette domain-containing protein [Eggerthellaceae bacterium]
MDLTVRRGSTVLLARRSGMGKTTVTKLINGLIRNSGGSNARARWSVRLRSGALRHARLAQHVGSVFQNPKSQFFNSQR